MIGPAFMRFPVKNLPAFLTLLTGKHPIFFWSYYMKYYPEMTSLQTSSTLQQKVYVPISKHLSEIWQGSEKSPGTSLMAMLLFAIGSFVFLIMAICFSKKTRLIAISLSLTCSFMSIYYIFLQDAAIWCLSLGFLLYMLACIFKMIFLLQNTKMLKRKSHKVNSVENPYANCRHRAALNR